MNFKELQSAVKHILKTCTCLNCKEKYEIDDVHVIATTKNESLFEIKCKKCSHSTLVNVLLAPDIGKNKSKNKIKSKTGNHRKVSPNDILDTKIFLEKFDGNFKKIFYKSK